LKRNQAVSEYFRDLESELKPDIDKILNHPFIGRLHDAWLNKAQLQYFACQYNIYCNYFVRFLSACAANIPDDMTRMPIIDNLWEEHGEGDPTKSHRVLFENFAQALGMTHDQLFNAMPLYSTSICCENLFAIAKDSHFLMSLGALGPGTEYFTSEEYKIIVEGLKKYDFFSAEDLVFWTVHITLDDHHYSDMCQAISPWLTSDEAKGWVSLGARRAIDLEILFWDGLEANLPGR
jgi:pyrroloquinoline-quinone synthase